MSECRLPVLNRLSYIECPHIHIHHFSDLFAILLPSFFPPRIQCVSWFLVYYPTARHVHQLCIEQIGLHHRSSDSHHRCIVLPTCDEDLTSHCQLVQMTTLAHLNARHSQTLENTKVHVQSTRFFNNPTLTPRSSSLSD